MRGLVSALRAAGRVRLGLLSNAPRGTSATLEARGLVPLFDDAVVSGDVGLAKPDPAIYRLAAERLGVAPAACLFIDDMARNIEGARQAGMTGHLYEAGGFDGLVARLRECGALPRDP
jgi:HAD superfamily hydrolase (TIGR01509 family)